MCEQLKPGSGSVRDVGRVRLWQTPQFYARFALDEHE